MTRILSRRSRPLFTARPFTDDDTATTLSGVGGASLYVSSGPAGSLPPAIAARNYRTLTPGSQPAKLGNLVANTKTTRVATVTEPTAQFPAVALDPDKAYRLQVRTWKDDVELPTIFGERLINTDSSTELETEITGAGYLIRTELCQGGGVKFWFAYNEAVEGLQPVDFVLSRQSGPTSPDDVVTKFYPRKRRYSVEVAGLQDAGAYVFRISARNGATTKLIDNAPASGLYDIAVTADASGPPAVSSITWEER